MDTEDVLNRFLIQYYSDDPKKISHAEGYQMLFEELGETLLPCLLRLLNDPSPEVRACSINLLATRRPFEETVAAAIAPLIRDPNGLVMLTATDRLGEFPDSMVRPFLHDAFQMVFDHQDAEDVVPGLAAMRLCLRKGYQDYKDTLMPMVLSGVELYEEGLENYLLITTLQELGMIADE